MSVRRHIPLRRVSPRLLLPFLVSALVIGVCSKSSPLYPMNDWVDVNCFFTVGRGIRHGMVPYLDLYEQKGPLVYFLYALAALVSEESFIGVYFVETVCFAIFLHYSGRIAETLSGASWAYPVTAAVTGVLIPVTPAFSHGGSAEELMLPVLAFGLFTVIHSLDGGGELSRRQGVLLGAACAAVFWAKYTFCGLFAGLALGVAACYAVKKRFRELLCLIGRFLLGFMIPSAMILLWFAVRGALPEMLNAYIADNLSLYSRNIRSGQYDPPLQNLLNNLSWSVPAILGLLLAVFRKGRRMTAAALWLGAAGLFVFTYLNGRRYPYYALVLSVFTAVGPGMVFLWIRRRSGKHKMLIRRIAAGLTCLAVPLGPYAAYHLSPNTYLLGVPRDAMPQYRFAARIQETEDQTLINSGFLDGGFYFAAGVLPGNRFFCSLNLDLPEMQESIRASIQNGETAYVVTRQQKLKDNRHYRLIDQCSFIFEGRNWTYYLYRRKNAEPSGTTDRTDLQESGEARIRLRGNAEEMLKI